MSAQIRGPGYWAVRLRVHKPGLVEAKGLGQHFATTVTWELLTNIKSEKAGHSSPDVSNTHSNLRFFASGVFEVKPQLSLGWKHLSREGETADGLAEVGFPPVL